MSAQLLREAAALMRERAEVATPGPWLTAECVGGNRDSRRTLGTYSLVNDGQTEVAIVRGFSTEREPIAEHIASWHPAVALEVAAFLDFAAAYGDQPEPQSPTVQFAIAIARAYLGGAAA